MYNNPRFDESDAGRWGRWRDWLPSHTFQIRLGKTDQAILSDTTDTVSVYKGTLGAETDTDEDLECYNRGATIASGIWVNIIARGGGWECFPLECNP